MAVAIERAYKMRKEKETDESEDMSKLWCYCNEPSFGEMIQCDNEKYTIKWFHFDCLRIRCPMKGNGIAILVVMHLSMFCPTPPPGMGGARVGLLMAFDHREALMGGAFDFMHYTNVRRHTSHDCLVRGYLGDLIGGPAQWSGN